MKRKLLVFVLFYSSIICFSQDIIYKKDNTEIKVTVLEIDDEFVKFRNFEQAEGPIRSISKKEVFLIIYKDGTREKFTGSQPIESNTVEPTQIPNDKLSVNQEKYSTNEDLNKSGLIYVNKKLEQARSFNDIGKFCMEIGVIGVTVGFIGFLANPDGIAGPNIMLGGTGLFIVSLPISIYSGRRITYFENRKMELTLNSVPNHFFCNTSLNFEKNMAIGVRLTF